MIVYFKMIWSYEVFNKNKWKRPLSKQVGKIVISFVLLFDEQMTLWAIQNCSALDPAVFDTECGGRIVGYVDLQITLLSIVAVIWF